MSRRARLQLVHSDLHEDQVSPARGKKARRAAKAAPQARDMEQSRADQRWQKGIHPRSEGQSRLLEAISSSDITLGLGPAGTGKTYLAVCKAVEALEAGRVKRIILTRPAVEAGERLGFLPGDLKEKMDPYLRPLYDALHARMPWQKVSALMADRTIEVAPIAFLRGRTLAEAAIVIDEAQNATWGQLKMLTTRLGFGSFMVLTGDPDQSDLEEGDSGLARLADAVEGQDGRISVVRLAEADVVRHPVVQSLVRLFAQA